MLDCDEVESVPAPRTQGLLEIAWRRKWLASATMIAALGLGTLYFLLGKPTYQSRAQVLVVKKRPDTVTGIDTRNLTIEDYVATHAVLIRSPLILERAIRKRQLDSLEMLRDEEDIIEACQKALTVTRDRNLGPTASPVLDLTFRGPVKEECSVILAAIIESYKSFLDETYRDLSEDTLKLVTQARDGLEKDIARQEQAYQKFRREAPLLLGRNKDGNTLVQERLSSIEARRSTLLLRKAEIEGYLDAIAAADAKQGGRHQALLALLAEGAARFDSEKTRTAQPLAMQDQLLPLLLEEQKLLKTRGARHPDVLAVRNQITLARAFLASPTAPWQVSAAESAPAGQPANADPVDRYREYFQQLRAHVVISEKLLDSLFKKEHDHARALSRFEIEDEGYRNDIGRMQKLHEAIVQRLQNADLVKDVGGYDARTIAPASAAEKIKPSALLTFPAAFMLGALLSFGLAFMAETADKRFRSPEEARRYLGLPVLADVPFIRPAAGGDQRLDPLLCTVLRPRSGEADSIRRLRTALYAGLLGPGQKLLQITSPVSADGKSTLAANLAVSMAQSGKRVLLVDAELHRPRLHTMFDIAAESGLSTYLSGGVGADAVRRATTIAGLELVPAGPMPADAGEALTNPRFKQFLERMREDYDFIIIDTPPLLMVTDPGMIAQHADGVLLNIRLTSNTRAQALKAKEMLASLGARILGIVANESGTPDAYSRYGVYAGVS